MQIRQGATGANLGHVTLLKPASHPCPWPRLAQVGQPAARGAHVFPLSAGRMTGWLGPEARFLSRCVRLWRPWAW